MRDMTAGMLAAVQAGELLPALFVEAYFRSGPVNVWTGYGPIDWNGQTWQGLGSLLTLSTVAENSNIEAKGIALTLSGIDPTLLTGVLSEFAQGLPVTCFLGLYDTNGALIPDPVVAWAGRTDQPTIDMDGQQATITIACENRLVEMNVAVDRRYTNEDQQLEHPGDRGMEFVDAIQEVTIFWGRTPSSHNNL